MEGAFLGVAVLDRGNVALYEPPLCQFCAHSEKGLHHCRVNSMLQIIPPEEVIPIPMNLQQNPHIRCGKRHKAKKRHSNSYKSMSAVELGTEFNAQLVTNKSKTTIWRRCSIP